MFKLQDKIFVVESHVRNEATIQPETIMNKNGAPKPFPRIKNVR